MIDKKRMEEAAHQHMIDEYYIADADDWEFPCAIDDIKQQCEFDFKAGVQWAQEEFVKSLWHDAGEKPIMSEHGQIIVELDNNPAVKHLWRSVSAYETLCNQKGYIRRWAYLDDILPKGGGQ